MLSMARRLHKSYGLFQTASHFRTAADSSPPPRRRPRHSVVKMPKTEEKSEWWAIDGEMHEIGENVPPRERYVIPRDNIPNKRRKQLREQFMHRTRLVLNESDHGPWCRRYLELYRELRENWEKLYWDEGYSKKLGRDHANYDSAEDDDDDFSPYRKSVPPHPEQIKDQNFGGNRPEASRIRDKFEFDRERRLRDKAFAPMNYGGGENRQGDVWQKASQIRDKFEFDRERRMRDKASAPMNYGGGGFVRDDTPSRNQPLDAQRYFSELDRSD